MTIRTAGVLALVAGLLGCNAPSLGRHFSKLRYIDSRSQECVDGALRRDPDPTVLVEAAERFDAGCRAGDPAACSLLGVMHDRGLAVVQDSAAARKLYARACSAGNKLGCTHLVHSNVLPPNLAFGEGSMEAAATARR
jgi:TPR repeat protein